MEAFDYPPEFFCASSENRIDYQTEGKCAAYAAAYLLRRFGEDTDGEALFPELKRTLGFVSANSIVDVFERYGYQAKACHGSVDTLKQRLTEGNPIIVFIRIPGDTWSLRLVLHYWVDDIRLSVAGHGVFRMDDKKVGIVS